MSEKKIMIIGLGNIGNYALEFLARTPGVDSIITADVDKEVGLSKTYNAMLGAAQMGFYPRIEFAPLDLFNIEETASILSKFAPDVILSCVTLQTYWVISELPEDLFKKLKRVGLGPWLPMHLTLNYKLMQAVRNARIKAHTVISAYPDVTCHVLGKVGLAPTVGLGNMDILIPEIKKLVGEKLGIHIRSISVYMISHHGLGTAAKYWGEVGNIPYYLKIFAENKDVTGEFNLDHLLVQGHNLVAKWRGDSQCASSGVKNVLAILNNTCELTHSPGPNGLPGGYPIRLSSQGVEVVLPEGLNLVQAIRINQEGQKHDGIEKIEDDGTVVCTEKAVNIMKEVFGYDCRRLKVEESEEKAKELVSLYREYVKKFKQ